MMMQKNRYLLLLILLIISCSSNHTFPEIEVKNGVSKALAEYRKDVLDNIVYQLQLDIPENKDQEIHSVIRIDFDYFGDSGIQLDFKERKEKLKNLTINGSKNSIFFEKEHLIIADDFLKKGSNSIEIEFVAGDAALNRRDDYLYTLFVPDRARTVFPLFDQPDLKAVFNLSLVIPAHWQAISNGRLEESDSTDAGLKLKFASTEKLPSYLFSFVAGDFKTAREEFRGETIELFYRETDEEKVSGSLPVIFELYKDYVEFYEKWTEISYPFQKHGLVAIPDFQFGGMEHPGAILLQSSTLFLPDEATKDQLNNRAHLLAHEVAHMWFGDLVTMKWFNDVWIKEVFANFIADKATADLEDPEEVALKFLIDHFPAAYAVDRTTGANPIRQVLENLEDAGTMYGNIIYHKAPIMMYHLEKLMGEELFQSGIQEYLSSFTYDNATWPDLIKILNKYTSVDLTDWNEVWVNDPGRPVFNWDISFKEDKISTFSLIQKPEMGEERSWSQSFDLDLHYSNEKTIAIEIQDSLEHQSLKEVIGLDKPDFVQMNPSGKGYGVMPVDTDRKLTEVFSLESKVARAAAYINLYENMLNQRYNKPMELLEVFINGLQKEKEELNLRLLNSYIQKIYWNFIDPEARKALVNDLEKKIWKAMELESDRNNKKILFKSYQNIFQTDEAINRLYTIWDTQNPSENIHLTEEDYTELAFSLELRNHHPGILDEQYSRISNPDRKRRFEIIKPALSFDKELKDQFFKELEKRKNRSNEAAVLTALGYFHHPLRQSDTERYLTKSLELLPEIQKTGDIFFPGRWVAANFGSYQSSSAYKVVQDFLKENPQINSKLKEKILQETDDLRRSQVL